MKPIHNIQEFNSLYNENYANYIRFAIGYVRDQHIAEDFASEAFTIYWEKRGELSTDINPKAYILTVLKNKCLNYLQHIRVKQRVKNDLSEHQDWLLTTQINTLQACDPDVIFSEEIKQIVDSTINNLPEKTRIAYILSRNQNLTNKEIAMHMHLSVKSIEYHISNALAQLRISLKDFIYIMPFLYFI